MASHALNFLPLQIAAHAPDQVDMEVVKGMDPITRHELAFRVAEDTFGVHQLLEPSDTVNNPDEKSIMTYIAALTAKLPDLGVHVDVSRNVITCSYIITWVYLYFTWGVPGVYRIHVGYTLGMHELYIGYIIYIVYTLYMGRLSGYISLEYTFRGIHWVYMGYTWDIHVIYMASS